MKRHLTQVVRWALSCLLVAVMGVEGTAGAQESTVRRGAAGAVKSSAVVNFSDVAQQPQGAAVRKRRADAPKPRSGSTTSIAFDTGSGGGSAPLLTAASALPSPPASATFQALLDNATTFNPDTQGAVGSNHLVVMLSSQVRIQNRNGGTISTVSLDAFWGTVGQSNVFDPRILYDMSRQRWLTAAINNPGRSSAHLLFGISQTSDPTGNWHLHSIQVDTNDGVYAVSPSIGFSRDWVVISANMMHATGQYYDYTDIFAFNRTNVYSGAAPVYHRWSHYPVVPAGADQEPATPIPAVHYDENSPTNFLVANVGSFAVDGLGRLRVLSISGPVNEPLFNDYGQALYIAAGANFGFPGWVSEAPGDGRLAFQAGTTNRIYITDSRIQNVVYRNGALWATHHVFLPTNNPTRVSAQWWSFSPGGTVLQFGRMDDPTGAKMFAYPSIGVNRYEDVLLGYTRFAANQFPSANYAFHSYQDGLGQLSADTVLKAGEAKFTVADGELILWGDWSATMPDPRNDTDLWTLQEYAAAPLNSLERWGTWWGRVSPPTSFGVSVVALPEPLVAGSNITYTTYITNFSSHIATGVRFTNALPAGAVFVSASITRGTCSQTNGVVTCDLGDVPGDVFTNVVVTATVVARLNQGGSATNWVSVGGYSPDELPLDNTAMAVTTVATASDIAVTLVPSAPVVIISNNVTLAMTVTNRGPSTAGAFFVTNVLPAGMTFVSASSSSGTCTNLAGRVTCVFGSMNPSVGATASIVARVTVSGALSVQTTARPPSLDPDLSNNTATAIVRGNNLPVLQPISNRTIAEDAVLGPINFAVSDIETLPENLELRAFSSNPAIVPPQNIVFGGVGGARDVTITPALNASGNITITRTLTDGDGSVVSNSFVLQIDAVNDAPSISDISDQGVNEDTVVGPLSFVMGDPETAATALTLSVSSSNPALIPNASIVFGGAGSNRTVRLTPTTNQSGSAVITITVRDGVLSTVEQFTVNVAPLNDLPTISDTGNRSINEDTTSPTIFYSVNDVETHVTNLVVTVSSSNTALVPLSGITNSGIGSSRSAVIRPATNQFGTATITFSVTDTNGGVSSDSFVLTVLPVNDPPLFSAPAVVNFDEDAGPQTISLTGISPGATNETDTLTFTVTSSVAGLVPSPGVIPHVQGSSTNSFIITPATNSNGTTVLTVQVNDGRGSNNLATRTITVNVNAVNDMPTITGLTDRTINEDGTTGPMSFTIGDVESTPAFLNVWAESSDTNKVPLANIVFGAGTGASRSVNVNPAADQNGTVDITVFVRDAGATNSLRFTLNILPVNDLPTIAPIANRTTDEDVAMDFAVAIGDKETVPGLLVLGATSSDVVLFPVVQFDGTDANRTMRLVPATNLFGSATITVTVSDGEGGSNSTQFVVSVLPVNDAPTLDAIAPILMAEDVDGNPVTLSGISSGAANESQPLTVTAVSTNSGLITNLVVTHTGNATTGTLAFELVPDAHGEGFITVQVSDGALTVQRTLALTVTAVNDAPVINQPAMIEIDEDTVAFVPLELSDDETAPGELVVQVSSSNVEVLDETGIEVQGAGAIRTLRLSPLEEQSGSTTITVTVTDGSNDVTTVSFDLNVRAINDAPIISAIAGRTIPEDSAAVQVSFTVLDAEVLSSSLLVSASSSNQQLLPDVNLVLFGDGVSRTLTLVPVANEYGVTTVSVIARDAVGPEGLSSTNTFVVTVEARNDAPTLDAIASLIIAADAGLQTVSLSGIGMGVANDNQTLTVTAVSSDAAVIPTPDISYTSPASIGALSFTPPTGATGVVQVTVFVTESGGATEGETNRIARVFSVNVSGPGPALRVEQFSGEAVISWSTNSLLNWRLESTTNLTAPASWTADPSTPAVLGDRFTVTNALDGVTRFYRLRNQ